MKKEKITLLCIIPIIDEVGNKRFLEGKRYDVVFNHNKLVSLIDEFGYKMNFSKNEVDLNLLHVWDYFYSIDAEALEACVEKIR